MGIEIYPLGAGQEIGRSCIILNILDKTIMLDCGLHMTHTDQRRFPDFSKIPPNDSGNNCVNLVLITHFHLDHCGALPFFSEINHYNGPIVMTMPTKALLPFMLEDYRKIWTPQGQKKEQSNMQQEPQMGEQSYYQIASNQDPFQVYTSEQIRQCVQKVKVINIMETQIYDGIEVKAYYAGHLLGACMFYIKYKNHTIVYTGDFNSLSDRHLGAAYIDQLQPDLLISESTYATIIRDSKRTRERNFLMQVQETLENGGKVLIPVFALGRAQELSVLLESFWERTNCKFGLYFAAGLIEKVFLKSQKNQFIQANQFYKLFVNWESEKIQNSFLTENIFNFKHIRPFNRSLIISLEPMVLLATPGMLHGGLSMQVFKEWCSNEKNSLIIPGYCVAGTLGNKLLQGIKKIKIDNKDYEVKMKVNNMSFSAHADGKGIMQLISHLQPKKVAFVHGEASRMLTLAKLIEEQMKIKVHCPANFESIKLNVDCKLYQQIKLCDYMPENQDLNEWKQQGYLVRVNYRDMPNIIALKAKDVINEIENLIYLISGGERININFHEFNHFLLLEMLDGQSNKEDVIKFMREQSKYNDDFFDQIQIDTQGQSIRIKYDPKQLQIVQYLQALKDKFRIQKPSLSL